MPCDSVRAGANSAPPRSWHTYYESPWLGFEGAIAAGASVTALLALWQLVVPTPRVLNIRTLILGIVIAASVIRLAWLSDPEGWAGRYDPRTAEALQRAPQALTLLAVVLLVALWRRVVNASEAMHRIRSRIAIGRYKWPLLGVCSCLAAAVIVAILGAPPFADGVGSDGYAPIVSPRNALIVIEVVFGGVALVSFFAAGRYGFAFHLMLRANRLQREGRAVRSAAARSRNPNAVPTLGTAGATAGRRAGRDPAVAEMSHPQEQAAGRTAPLPSAVVAATTSSSAAAASGKVILVEKDVEQHPSSSGSTSISGESLAGSGSSSDHDHMSARSNHTTTEQQQDRQPSALAPSKGTTTVAAVQPTEQLRTRGAAAAVSAVAYPRTTRQPPSTASNRTATARRGTSAARCLPACASTTSPRRACAVALPLALAAASVGWAALFAYINALRWLGPDMWLLWMGVTQGVECLATWAVLASLWVNRSGSTSATTTGHFSRRDAGGASSRRATSSSTVRRGASSARSRSGSGGGAWERSEGVDGTQLGKRAHNSGSGSGGAAAATRVRIAAAPMAYAARAVHGEPSESPVVATAADARAFPSITAVPTDDQRLHITEVQQQAHSVAALDDATISPLQPSRAALVIARRSSAMRNDGGSAATASSKKLSSDSPSMRSSVSRAVRDALSRSLSNGRVTRPAKGDRVQTSGSARATAVSVGQGSPALPNRSVVQTDAVSDRLRDVLERQSSSTQTRGSASPALVSIREDSRRASVTDSHEVSPNTGLEVAADDGAAAVVATSAIDSHGLPPHVGGVQTTGAFDVRPISEGVASRVGGALESARSGHMDIRDSTSLTVAPSERGVLTAPVEVRTDAVIAGSSANTLVSARVLGATSARSAGTYQVQRATAATPAIRSRGAPSFDRSSAGSTIGADFDDDDYSSDGGGDADWVYTTVNEWLVATAASLGAANAAHATAAAAANATHGGTAAGADGIDTVAAPVSARPVLAPSSRRYPRYSPAPSPHVSQGPRAARDWKGIASSASPSSIGRDAFALSDEATSLTSHGGDRHAHTTLTPQLVAWLIATAQRGTDLSPQHGDTGVTASAVGRLEQRFRQHRREQQLQRQQLQLQQQQPQVDPSLLREGGDDDRGDGHSGAASAMPSRGGAGLPAGMPPGGLEAGGVSGQRSTSPRSAHVPMSSSDDAVADAEEQRRRALRAITLARELGLNTSGSRPRTEREPHAGGGTQPSPGPSA